MKIAIVHDWLTVYAGAEKVLEQIVSCFPDADIFSLVDFLSENERGFIAGKRVTTSFIQTLPKARSHFRNYLMLMPLAIEQFDLSNYDLVISSSHAFAKGVLVGPDQLHISYVHTPIRYAWDLQHQYLRESGLDRGLKGWLVRWFLHRIRIWDYRTAAGVDHFVANSRFISRRIRKVYGRESDIIYPPVDLDAFELCVDKQDYYLAVSRLVTYKRMDLIIQAFAKMPSKRLVVIGDGPELPKLLALATPNVTLLGFQPFAELKRHMQQAKAFVFAAEEDFGITTVEAQACGTPVIAYGKGGSLETVVDSLDSTKATGILYFEQTFDSIIQAVHRFEELPNPIDAKVCRAHAECFSVESFKTHFSQYLDRHWVDFQNSLKL